MKTLVRFFGVLFLVSAGLQFNDPDPLLWVILYLLAGVACLQPPGKGPGRHLAAIVAAVALGWAVVLAPEVESVRPGDMLASMEAKDGKVEVARELGGLALIFFGMIVVREGDRRVRNRSASEADWTASAG